MYQEDSKLEDLVETYYDKYREGMSFAQIRQFLLQEEGVSQEAIKGVMSMIDDLIIEEDANMKLKGVYRTLFYGLLTINAFALIFLAMTAYSYMKQEIPFTDAPGELAIIFFPVAGSFSGMFYVYGKLRRPVSRLDNVRNTSFSSSRWNDYKAERK